LAHESAVQKNKTFPNLGFSTGRIKNELSMTMTEAEEGEKLETGFFAEAALD